MTRLDEIRAWTEKHASPAGDARMRAAGRTFDLVCSTCRERWLLARVDELAAALRDIRNPAEARMEECDTDPGGLRIAAVDAALAALNEPGAQP